MKTNAPVIIYRHLADTTYYAEVIAVGTNGKGTLLASTNNDDRGDREQFGDCYKVAKSIAKRYAKFWGCESVGQHEKGYAERTKHFKDKWEPR